ARNGKRRLLVPVKWAFLAKRASQKQAWEAPGKQAPDGLDSWYAGADMLSRSPSPALPAGFVPPCLPTLARVVPDAARWAFEIKPDGFRFIARRDGDRVRVFSRNAKDWTDRVPLIVEALRALPVTSVTFDGEGVVVDERGLSDFERLRAALALRGGSRAA